MLPRLSFAILLAGFFIMMPLGSARAADVNFRDLVKLPDDGNPATQVDSTVYYVADDGRRYVYPNEKIFFSWRLDYSGVKVISASQMAQIPLGGNINYRPGTRLVKLQSDPKVYAVEPKGTLRWLSDGAAAAALYGDDWAKRVDDMSDAFFGDYRIGAPLGSAVWPTGSIVRAAGGALYYIEGATKRPLSSDAVRVDLRYRSSDVLAASNDLASYADGATMGTAEPDLTDDAQLGLIYVPSETVESRPAFEVDLYPAAGVDAVRGESGVTFASFILKATTDGANIVRSITFQGWFDEGQGNDDFGAGSDDDDGSLAYLRDIVPSIGLYDQDGTRISGPVTVGIDGKARFEGLTIEIPPGASRVVAVKGDVPAAAPIGAGPDKAAFDIENVETDVTVTLASGAEVPRTGVRPNNGPAPLTLAVIREKGEISFKWIGYVGYLVAGRPHEEIGYLEVKTSADAYELQTLTLQTIGTLTSIDQWILEYPREDGTTGTVTAPYGGSSTTLSGLAIPLKKNGYTTIRVWAKMKPKAVAQLNEEVRVDVLASSAFRFVSKSNGEVWTDSSYAAGAFTATSRQSALYVRHTLITASRAADTPTGVLPRGPTTTVLKFHLRAEPEGDARVTKLVFKITPGDTETIGPDNDALERWADQDGDAAKDEGMANLYRTDGSHPDPLAEETFSSIRYSIVHLGTEDTTPAGIDSAKNDYGRLTYELTSGDEISISAGSTADFTLQLDTTKFALNSHNLKVELLTGFDFAWTDAPGSGYVPITGQEIPGLPLATPGNLSVGS